MEINELLKSARKEYLEIKPPEKFARVGWSELRERLENKFSLTNFLKTGLYRPMATFALVALMLVLSLTGLVQVAKAALPGEPLYPVKRAYEDVVSLVTGNDEIKLDNRADEIVQMARENAGSEEMDQTIEEYRNEVHQAREKVSPDDEFSLEEKLKNHRREFESLSSEDEEVHRAIDEIESPQIEDEEVKGEKVEKIEGSGEEDKESSQEH